MSNSFIQPKALYEVGPVMAESLGLDWSRDRREVVDAVNRFRETLYLMDESTLFTDRFHCLKVEKFPIECLNSCSCSDNLYYGVTVPDDVDGVLTIWKDSEPMRIQSRWREGRVGIDTSCAQDELAATEVHETSATERPMQEVCSLEVYTSHPDDEGKIVNIKGVDENDNQVEVNFTLKGDLSVGCETLFKAVTQVVLPAGLIGSVTLSQRNGFQLSEYSPYETIPCFRRLRVPANCCTDQVLLHGNQKFRPICFDTDIVEVGSRLIIEAYAKFYRYGDRGTEADEIAKATLEERKFKDLVRQALKRKRGKAYQDRSPFRGRRITKSGVLPGYGGRRRSGIGPYYSSREKPTF